MKEQTKRKDVVADLRNLKPADLAAKVKDLKEELQKLELKHRSNQLETTSNLKKTKKMIARIYTIQNEQKGKASKGVAS